MQRRTLRGVLWAKLIEGIQQMDGRSCLVALGVLVFLAGLLSCVVPWMLTGHVPFLQSLPGQAGQSSPLFSSGEMPTPTPTPDPRVPQVQRALQDFCTAYTHDDTRRMFDLYSDQSSWKHDSYQTFDTVVKNYGMTTFPKRCEVRNVETSNETYAQGDIHYVYDDGSVKDFQGVRLHFESGQWKLVDTGWDY